MCQRPFPKAPAHPTLNTHAVNGKPVKWFSKRDDARQHGSVKDAFGMAPSVRGPNGERWFIYTA